MPVGVEPSLLEATLRPVTLRDVWSDAPAEPPSGHLPGELATADGLTRSQSIDEFELTDRAFELVGSQWWARHGILLDGAEQQDAARASETAAAAVESGAAVDGADEWAVPGVDWPAPERVRPEPHPAVAALAGAVDALALQTPSALPEAVALERTRELMQQSERLRMLAIEALADVDTRGLYRHDDSPSTTAWVRSQHVQGVDSSEVTLARRLRRVPQIAEEVKAGRMSSVAAAKLTGAMAKARPHLDRPGGLIDGMDAEAVLYGVIVDGVCQLIAEQIGGAADAEQRLAALRAQLEGIDVADRSHADRLEAGLVVFARECDPALLPSGVLLLLDALLPNEHQKRAKALEDDARLTLVPHAGGGGSIRGELDDETFAMAQTWLTALAQADAQAPDDTQKWADGRQAVGDDTLHPEDWPVELSAPRSKAQQRHDAFKRGLRQLLDSGVLGSRGKASPHTVVTTSLDFLTGVAGSLPARTEHRGRLAREQARALLARGRFTRMVLDARNRVIEASHTQRTATAFERLILTVQGGATCTGAGCARGPATGHRLIPHHGSLFSATGTTELDDAVALCEIEHDHELHGKRKNIRLKDGRVLGPDGWVRR